jgi:lysophospholipase L1-like esterase
MKKIILYGDSLLGRFGKSLIQKLESRVKNAEVYNCAYGGCSTEDCLRKSEFISKLNPDMVVISLGTNDILLNDLDTGEYLNNLSKIIENFNESRVIVWLIPKANDSQDVEGTNNFNKKVEKYNKIVRST